MNRETREETPNLCIIRASPGVARVVVNEENKSTVIKSRLSSLDDHIQKTENDIIFLTQEGNELRQRIEENDRNIKALHRKVERLLSLLG